MGKRKGKQASEATMRKTAAAALIAAAVIVTGGWQPQCRVLAGQSEQEAADACYEVFVYSFSDSNEDGIGDLQGLIGRLDYIEELGFDSIWLMPVQPSPTYHKYDVTDYYAIDPQYGTLADFDALTAACEERGIDVYLDLVINHTSAQHPWFTEASEYLRSLEPGQEADPGVCPYVEYYNFVQADEMKKSGWCLLPGTQDWYYECVFWDQMPDLNLDHPSVRSELEQVAAFWIDHGADGFRMDAALHYTESSVSKSAAQLKWFCDAVRSIKPDCYVVAEVWDTFAVITDFYEQGGAHSYFDFVLGGSDGLFVKTVNRLGNGSTGMKLSKNLQTIDETFRKADENAVDGVFLSNHDTGRAAGFVSYDENKLKLAAGLQLLSTGKVFVYYGDEIGMTGSGIDENKRAPMYWTDDTSAEMTDGPQAMEPQQMRFTSCEQQMVSENSIYQYYKKALEIRRRYPAISSGQVTALTDITEQNGNVCAVRKSSADSEICLLYNISDEPVTVTIPKGAVIYDQLLTGEETAQLEDQSLTIPAYGCVVLGESTEGV